MSERPERAQFVRRVKKPRPDAAVKARADQLVTSGMPYQMAMAVAHGRMDLNTALERMAMRDRVNTLMERHALSRALATQIAMGHAELDHVLARRRLADHREVNRDRTALVPESELSMVLAEGGACKGVVKAVQPYHVHVAIEGEAAPREFHKLSFLYCYDPAHWKAVKKAVRVDKKQAPEAAAPAVRPQDRYSCSDRRLFGYLDRTLEVNVTLVNGEQLRGVVTWFGRYEFGLRLKGDADITVFRHALRDVGPAT